INRLHDYLLTSLPDSRLPPRRSSSSRARWPSLARASHRRPTSVRSPPTFILHGSSRPPGKSPFRSASPTAVGGRGTRRAPTSRTTGSGSCHESSRGARGPCRITTAAAPYVSGCATACSTKPLILAQEALLEPTAVSYWLVMAVALLVPVPALLILPRRVRPWVLLAAGIFGSLVILGDVVYYRFFGD